MNNAFASLLNFSQEDLKQNQNGTLSENQKQKIMKHAYMEVIGIPVAGVLITAAAYYFANQRGDLSNFPLIAAGILVGSFAIAGYFFWQTSQTVKNGKVEKLSGKVQNLRIKDTTLYVTLGDRVLNMPSTASQSFKQNTSYTFYYTPGNMSVISVEEG